MPGVSKGDLVLWWGAKSCLGRTLPTPQCIPSTAAVTVFSECLPALLHKLNRAGGTEESMWFQDREPGAGHGGQCCRAPKKHIHTAVYLVRGLTSSAAPAVGFQQPWASRRRSRFRVASRHFRAGAHIPSLPLKLSTAACCVLLLLILYDKHCQQTNIT